MTSPTFTGPHGMTPREHILKIAASLRPTAEDCLYAGQLFARRKVAATSSGLDVRGAGFIPYSAAYAKQRTRRGMGTVVTLTGSGNHPRMLDEIEVHAGGQVAKINDTLGIPGPQVVSSFQVGLYGEEATRARAHNEGRGKMPKREWLTPTDRDAADMQTMIGDRAMQRIKAVAA